MGQELFCENAQFAASNIPQAIFHPRAFNLFNIFHLRSDIGARYPANVAIVEPNCGATMVILSGNAFVTTHSSTTLAEQ